MGCIGFGYIANGAHTQKKKRLFDIQFSNINYGVLPQCFKTTKTHNYKAF